MRLAGLRAEGFLRLGHLADDAVALAPQLAREGSSLGAFTYRSYTRSPLEIYRLFGPSPWKILRHYL